MAKNLKLWRLTFNGARGTYWLYMRDVLPENAAAWQAQFEKDEPVATYCVAAKAPKIKDGDHAKARHVATF